ncbi:MAG: hypothetical protein JSR66_17065 [Proteobacteria bacterium]|nr:hypothetical protein [Pseudomonadota bacterium]
MHHRELLLRMPVPPAPTDPWSCRAVRDLEVAINFGHVAAKHPAGSMVHAGAALGALMSYSRPFTERADAVNQTPEQRGCFLSLAADLGADLRLHGILLQMRDGVIALSDIVSSQFPPLNARRFKYPDSRVGRITRALNPGEFCRLAATMRLACHFFQAEIDIRIL